jgi:hypothetical protein
MSVTARSRACAGGADQARGGALRVIQQGLQKMVRRDPLMKFADRNGLGGLEKTPRPLSELLDIHSDVPFSQATGMRAPKDKTASVDQLSS